jgi:hypothetical protein
MRREKAESLFKGLRLLRCLGASKQVLLPRGTNPFKRSPVLLVINRLFFNLPSLGDVYGPA